MKLVVAAFLTSSAAAFSLDQVGKAITALNSFDSELGGQANLGFFDPFYMLSVADQERFGRLWYGEVKHVRVAQIAFLGQIVTSNGTHLSVDIYYSGTSFDSISNGWADISGPNAVPQDGLIQIFLFVGDLDIAVMKDVTGESEFPGNFHNGAFDFGWDTFDEDIKLSKRAIDLNNGRTSMIGILGLMVHEMIVGSLLIVGDMQETCYLPW